MQDIVILAYQKQTEDISRAGINFEKLLKTLKVAKIEPGTNETYAAIQAFREELAAIEEQHGVLQQYIEEAEWWE